ncbi:hypothetical protein CYMTET_18113 [Cymbomonas tetramitiformis]|uniref:Uncharacterized protein n=1 Tax=Cymbomonas tetramitiformis TaxID=36881 RepID=A0AAE0G8Y2_9CHLO|nr:hypothetical protein CYMTET_18113 [Cymbomonas tetramitiformis]
MLTISRGAADGVQGLVQLLRHWEQVWDALWAQGSATDSGEQGSCWRLPWELGKLQLAQADDWVQLVVRKLRCAPPEGGHFSGHSTRKGAFVLVPGRWAGTALESCCFLGG